MPTLFDDLLHTFNDPALRHAAMVHLPIALCTIAPIVLFVSACKPAAAGRRILAVAMLAAIAAIAIVTANTGESAEANLGQLTASAQEIVHEHEEAAEKVWMFAAALAMVTFAGFVKLPIVRRLASWAALLGSLGLLAWIARVAHLGGTAVYEHGAGVASDRSTTPVAAPAPSDPRLVFFREQIRPALDQHCMGCHNATRQKGGLDLTSAAGWLRGGGSGTPAVVPGKPDESRLLQAVKHLDPSLSMPPDETLSDDVINAFERWIREGAVWEDEAIAETSTKDSSSS